MTLEAGSIIQRMKISCKAQSDSELARYLGVTSQAICKFKKQGELPPGIVFRFAFIASVSLDWLVTGDETVISKKHDEQLLQGVLEFIENTLGFTTENSSIETRASLISTIYKHRSKKS